MRLKRTIYTESRIGYVDAYDISEHISHDYLLVVLENVIGEDWQKKVMVLEGYLYMCKDYYVPLVDKLKRKK